MIQLDVMPTPLARGHVLMELPLLRNSHLFLEDMFKINVLGPGHLGIGGTFIDVNPKHTRLNFLCFNLSKSK
jgi:hypothetical protein